MHSKGRPQSMSFPLDYHNLELAGGLNRIKRVLKERGLWLEGGLVLHYPTPRNRLSCNSDWDCCARRVLGAEGFSGSGRAPTRGRRSTK